MPYRSKRTPEDEDSAGVAEHQHIDVGGVQEV